MLDEIFGILKKDENFCEQFQIYKKSVLEIFNSETCESCCKLTEKLNWKFGLDIDNQINRLYDNLNTLFDYPIKNANSFEDLNISKKRIISPLTLADFKCAFTNLENI